MFNSAASLLLDKRAIGQEELGHAVVRANSAGSTLEEVLLADGVVNPHTLYTALAEANGLEFADLFLVPCDAALLDADAREEYQALRAIPWKKAGDAVVIATCGITEALEAWAARHYPVYYFAITSPFDIHHSINRHFEEVNTADAKESLWRVHPEFSAQRLFGGIHSTLFAIFALALVGLALAFPKQALLTIFVVMTFFYAATLGFKTLLFVIGALRGARVAAAQEWLRVPDRLLPVYTILVPLYQEAEVLGKLTKAIRALDYPPSKLDVKLIVEADDAVTIEAIRKLKCGRMFEMVRVPFSLPRTKPKACNYALRFARGEFVTIYDAEDEPEPLQLKKVLYSFAHEPDDVVCIQAKLNYFNRKENTLTRLFSIEYSTLFDFLLFGLEAMGLPIPLGGTSNHFRLKHLKDLYAWDPYNVTEDADLGLRIAQKGWRCKMIDSLTKEESPIHVGAWLRQRSRWIKGHMQTYFVHMRHPLRLYRRVGLAGFMGVQFFLGAPALVFLVSPLMWLGCFAFLLHIATVPTDMPEWFDGLVSISFNMLWIGALLQIGYAATAVWKNGWRGMWRYCLIFPLYWALHSVASFKALWQLITRPHYWEKTSHGVTKVRG